MPNRCNRLLVPTIVVLLLLLPTAMPCPAAAAETPADLEAWSDWVLRDVQDYGCPALYNAPGRRCSFPGRLALELDGGGGTFSQSWQLARETRVTLPGDRDHWPLEITVDDAPVAVVEHQGRPALTLSRGQHSVLGRFRWQQLPAALAIPADSGLVTLRLEGKPVASPDLRNGQLWLSATSGGTDAVARVDIKVFRKLSDTVPLALTTRIELEVSGEQREVTLSGALLGGFEPVAVHSQLPARLDAGGTLRLKLRAGRWVVSVESRLNRAILALQTDAYPAPWPAEELWVFEAQPQLRMLRIISPDSIDASQSALPQEWKSLPAYRMQAGTPLRFEQIRRGDPEPEPNQLVLARNLWLDFAGEGYAVSDHISGTLARGWRINAAPGLIPGQVTLDGQPQLITRAADGSIGVEVRQGNLALAADSRIEASVRHFSAVGWDHDFSKVTASINVPPGYRVLAISGADQAPTTWLSRWTLLDFFIVLISSIALSKLYARRWGALGLVGLAALWHEPGAPAYIWLNLIVTLALLRAVHGTRVHALVRNYLVLSAVALLLLALPFMVAQVRDGIYPQLERAWQALGDTPAQRQPGAPPASLQQAFTGARTETAQDRVSGLASSGKRLGSEPDAGFDRLVQDPGAKLQTGAGLPEWTWRSYPVSWNGPVTRDQSLAIYLIGPAANLLFNLFRVGMVLLLGWKLLHTPLQALLAGTRHGAGAAALALLAIGLAAKPDAGLAAYPPEALLAALRERLLEPADCLPQCAELERLAIRLDAGQAEFSLRVHAAANVALPLPVPLNEWMPSTVTIDGTPATALFRAGNDALWLYVEAGVHTVDIQGRVSHLNALRLDFPLPPHALTVALQGWSSEGTGAPRPRSLSFTRNRTHGDADDFDTRSEIPVFAHVSRHLRLGLDWQLATTVQLESGTALPAVLRIPLLEGEAVLTDGIEVEAGHAVITLSESARAVGWHSTLAQREHMTLTAAQDRAWSEAWRLEVTPIWNVRPSGIPAIYHQQADGEWQPQWQPWPGEQVELAITRPQGIEGQTLTIDRSRLLLTPGRRVTAAELAVSIRSSQGQQHTLTLPTGARLESVTINGSAMPVRQDGRSVTLPLRPGNQDIVLQWQEPRGSAWWFASPAVDLGSTSVNSRITVRPGHDRWVLLTGGIRQGPAVLFWGVLIVVVVLALLLGRIKGTPLHTSSWILLGIGLTTVTPFIALLIAAWIFALYARGRSLGPDHAVRFDAMQVGLVLLTLIALAALFGAVSNGLLGNPEMQIAGNGSSRGTLNWYQDRIDSVLPQAWFVSLPVLAYRFLMLAWSMWLAFALIRWLKWGWNCFAHGRLWLPLRRSVRHPDGGSPTA